MISNFAVKVTSDILASDWKSALAHLIRDPAELLNYLELNTPIRLAQARQAATLFPLRVTHSFMQRMQIGNPDDPLLRQVLPLHLETESHVGYQIDPLEEKSQMPVPSVLHKYPGRALLIVNGSCAIHCRYCFRREFPYQENGLFQADHLQQALDYIRKDQSIHEVILSGGDPLTLSNSKLAELLMHLTAIPNLQRIRIHSRLPIVLPERIDSELVAIFNACRLPLLQVIHCNHAQEINTAVATGLKRLRTANAILLNQAVLLKGVNDSVSAQADLAAVLVANGVTPYYLHMLDKVKGAQHFAVSKQDAIEIITALRNTLSGYMVPKLVFEQPGELAKTPLGY